MTLTRTRLDRCATKDCPWRDDLDFHAKPWCRAIPSVRHLPPVTHQHHPKKGMGGNNPLSKIVALLCFECHDRIDNRDWGNAVHEWNGKRWYKIWDLHGEILYERDIGASSATVEVPDGSGADASTVAPGPSASTGEGEDQVSAARDAPVTLPSPAGAPASSATTEGRLQPSEVSPLAATQPSAVAPGARAPEQAGREGAGPGIPPSYAFTLQGIEWEPEYTLKDWAEAAAQIMRESAGRQWRVGDLVNAERWAECSHFYDIIDYPPETQANYGRISAAYKLAERRALSFGHHQSVYKHPERLRLLDAAVENRWTRAELKAVAYPDTRIRIRRFTIEELKEQAIDFWDAETKNNGRKFLAAFLDWLGKGEQSSG